MTKVLATLAVLAAAGLAIAGCGGGGSSGSTGSEGEGGYGGSSSTTSSSAVSSGSQADGAVVSAAVTPKLGRAIVDPEGFTLYDFHKDRGATSSCYGACAQAWPPLLTRGSPQAGEGAIAAKLGTTKRKDGTVQVTYASHPLYTYAGDTKPGDTTGNDISSFGAQWYALGPSGEELGG
jgi:predicted lipoprotein with Yx(FWY)xxD motif